MPAKVMAMAMAWELRGCITWSNHQRKKHAPVAAFRTASSRKRNLLMLTLTLTLTLTHPRIPRGFDWRDG